MPGGASHGRWFRRVRDRPRARGETDAFTNACEQAFARNGFEEPAFYEFVLRGRGGDCRTDFQQKISESTRLRAIGDERKTQAEVLTSEGEAWLR